MKPDTKYTSCVQRSPRIYYIIFRIWAITYQHLLLFLNLLGINTILNLYIVLILNNDKHNN